jgi:hypothetical protein
VSAWDWFGLMLEALPVLVLAAIFLSCVWVDAIEPWLFQRWSRKAIERKLAEQPEGSDRDR